jgi:solute carrier family 7 L-type amino acid transporter-like protein
MSASQNSGYSPVATNPSASKNGKGIEQMQADDGVAFKKSMGLISGCNVCIGTIIGSGIFVSPGGVLMQTGSIGMALIVWVICGIVSAIGAYCYAELGLIIKKSGGDYAYIHYTFGPFVGFVRLWVECVMIRPSLIAIVALTFAKYVTKPFFVECEPPDTPVRLLAAICICKIDFNIR